MYTSTYTNQYIFHVPVYRYYSIDRNNNWQDGNTTLYFEDTALRSISDDRRKWSIETKIAPNHCGKSRAAIVTLLCIHSHVDTEMCLNILCLV